MKRSLLYIIDNVNYPSGVQKITAYQANQLSEDYDISVFSLESPGEEACRIFSKVTFLQSGKSEDLEPLTAPFFQVMKSRRYTLRQKCMKLIFSLAIRMGKHEKILSWITRRSMETILESFDTICVVSEASCFRQTVAARKKPRKIQWIHTDYSLWSDYSDWTRAITFNDRNIYDKYDTIVCLTETSRQGFVQKFPCFDEKTIVLRNLIPVEEILQKAEEPINEKVLQGRLNMITVGRIDREKAFDRTLPICRKLKDMGISFHWYIVGGGVLFSDIQKQIHTLGLENEVEMTGMSDNPYPLMKSCDLFLLLSRYEGLPVTIDESLILGTPVIATDVGGIREQIEDNYGYLVNNNQEDIACKLLQIIETKSYEKLDTVNIEIYLGMNKKILEKLKQLF